jgi:hypothetical protein
MIYFKIWRIQSKLSTLLLIKNAHVKSIGALT